MGDKGMNSSAGISGPMILTSIGAILAYAVKDNSEFFEINVVGIILLICGIIWGVAVMWTWFSQLSNHGQAGMRRDDRYREDDV
jgi:hypothetical protein